MKVSVHPQENMPHDISNLPVTSHHPSHETGAKRT